MTEKNWLGQDNVLGADIWKRKYQQEDETFDEWLDRVSGYDADVRDMIEKKEFIFGGRILASRGLTGRKVTYSNCYVITPPEDNIESIFNTASKLARTYSYGGGCGVDISKLRPKGAPVNNSAKETSGAVSFMDLFDLTTALIGQNGRRGALMLSIDVSHPDVEDFISVKSDLSKVTKANISVKIDDEFMACVRDEREYELKFESGNIKISKMVDAKKLFMKLVEQNWDFAEPGILFWDRIKEYNLLQHDEDFEFAGTNPCAEEPLPAGGSCLLGSVILTSFVEDGLFQFEKFAGVVRRAVRALNIVLDEGLLLHPLAEQRETVRDWRQIGLGVLGVGDMLIKMGLKYDTDEAISLCDTIGQIMAHEAMYASAILSKHHGPYPMYKMQKVMDSDFFVNHASMELIEVVKQYGLRNSQLLTIAPTGTLGTMLEISTGMEPNFAFSYTRKTESLHGTDVYYKVFTKIAKDYMAEHGIENEEDLPEYFVSAQTIDPIKRVEMQGAWQRHIDASISSTVNIPNHATKEDVYNIYMRAWEEGLKGATIFRDGCARLGILTLDNGKEEESVPQEQELKRGEIKDIADDTIYHKRPLNIGCGKLKLFVGYSQQEKAIQDLYVVKAGNGGCEKNIQAVAIFMSGILRLGGNLFTLEKSISGISGCTSFSNARATGRDVSKGGTCSSAILNILKDFEREMEIIPSQKSENAQESFEEIQVQEPVKHKCPECGNELVFAGGCVSCTCGFSKCD